MWNCISFIVFPAPFFGKNPEPSFNQSCFLSSTSPFRIKAQPSAVVLLSVLPLCSSRLRTSCMTWFRTWTRGRKTWRRGLLCWRPSWRPCWVTCRPCRGSSVRSSASSTGTSWRCSSSLTTNTAPSARSLRPGGGRPPRPRPPPPRAARARGKCLHWRLLPSYGQVAFIVKPYGFNKYDPNSDDRIRDTGDSTF